jgi:uncharacterized phage-associated protein
MSERKEFEQLRDEFTVWLLLCKLEEAGFETQRLKLQKLMYLVDVFGTLLYKKPTSYTFRVYKHGPYTKEIQCDVEHLVSSGMVEAQEVKGWNPSKERQFKYKIRKYNRENAKNIHDLLDFSHEEKIVDFVVQAAGCLSSKDIKSLVYSEPNFVQARTLVLEGKKEFASAIDYKFTDEFKEIAKQAYEKKFGEIPSDNEVSWYYLNFIQSQEDRKQLHSDVEK